MKVYDLACPVHFGSDAEGDGMKPTMCVGAAAALAAAVVVAITAMLPDEEPSHGPRAVHPEPNRP